MGKPFSKIPRTVRPIEISFSDMKGVCFIWKIMNFSMLPHRNGERLVSDIFAIDSKMNVGLFLVLYPKGDKLAPNNISSYLCLTKNVGVKLKCSFTLVSTEPSTHISRSFNHVVAPNGFGFRNLISINEIYDRKNLYLPEDTLIIRCEVNTSNETSAVLNVNDQPASKLMSECFVCHTGMEVQRKEAFTWPIRNIKQCIDRGEIRRNLFRIAETPALMLSLHFNKNLSANCIGIRIMRLPRKKTVLKCKVTVISANSHYQAFKESTHLFKEGQYDDWHFPSFIPESMLTKEKFLFADDSLFLLWEFTFYETGSKRIREWGSCIRSIYDSGKFCDVELKVGSKTFPFYKVVLCAKSPVFYAMFETDMREKHLNVVKIPDVDPDTMRRMLSYMLSDTLEKDLSPNDACKLYKAADKYDIGSLKYVCSISLQSALSVQNACDLLIFTDAYHDELLMTALQNFYRCHGHEIKNSPQWNSFVDDHPKLATKIMPYMLSEKYPDVDAEV